MKLTIRKKLLGLSLLSIVAPLVVSGVVILWQVGNRSGLEANEKMKTYSSAASALVAKRMDEIAGTVGALAIPATQYDFVGSWTRPAPGAAAAAQELDRKRATYILDTVKKQARLDYLTLVGPTGQVVYRSNTGVKGGGDLAALDPVVKEAIAKRQIIQTSVKLPLDIVAAEKLEELLKSGTKTNSSALALEVAVPLISAGQLVGVLVGGDVLNNDAITGSVLGSVFEDKGSAAVTFYLDDTAVASSKPELVGKTFDAAIAGKVKAEKVGQGGLETIQDIRYQSMYQPIKDLSGQIIGMSVVSMKEEVFSQFKKEIQLQIIGLLVIAVLISFLVTFIIAGRLTKPIEEITEAANKISLGDLEVPIQVQTSGDELEHLAESLERMRISLKSAIERLRRR